MPLSRGEKPGRARRAVHKSVKQPGEDILAWTDTRNEDLNVHLGKIRR